MMLGVRRVGITKAAGDPQRHRPIHYSRGNIRVLDRADSRRRLATATKPASNAGLDSFAKFAKMSVFEPAKDRVIAMLSSFSLAGTQTVIRPLMQRGDGYGTTPSLWNANTMYDIARLVSDRH